LAPAAPLSAPVSAPPAAPVVVVPDTTTRFTAPLAPSVGATGAAGADLVLDRVVVQPTHPSDFLAQIPTGLRIEITAANQSLPSNVNPAQPGSLGGSNADPLSPPVDLQLHAKDIVTNAEVPLPDGALAPGRVTRLVLLLRIVKF
jgi:hypothetical protein